MTSYNLTSSVLTLLVFITFSRFHLAAQIPVGQDDDRNPYRNISPDMTVTKDQEKSGVKNLQEDKADEELFKDVDPKTLAAVLLEALNHSLKNVESEQKGDAGEEENQQVGMMQGADQDRGGRQKLELLMATQEREQEEEERKKAQEEEEKMTEKVTSLTKSHTIQVPAEPKSANPEGVLENVKQGGSSSENGDEEEEQLNSEELKSLETMMKEFPRVDTVGKRKVDSDQNLGDSRGYNINNYFITISKGGNLAMSKKKLKWQEETQKALNLPSFREGNFMDDFVDGNYERNPIQSPVPPAEPEVMEEDSPDVPQDEDEKEEEEARAKAEQEEMRRQAAEALRAKIEEEKLADIASDMLLHYMVKQRNGNKKYNPSLSNAAEDKRSDEEQEVNQEDDIDPQTIDKLIEISSKLHLPADDVVDIISDVEKKKKKDMTPLSSSFLSKNSFMPSKVSADKTRLPAPAVNLLKTWFQGKTHTKTKDHWSKPVSSLLSNQNMWPKALKPLSFKQDIWHKTPKSVWTGYPSYPINYPFYYKRKLYPDYYTIYKPSPLRPKPRYYIPKPFTLNRFLDGSAINGNKFENRYRYEGWVQPQIRMPPSSAQSQPQPYYKSYPLPLYPRTLFQPLALPESRSLPRFPVMGPLPKERYYSTPVPAAMRDNKYGTGKQSDSSSSSSRADIEKYIRQILMNRAHQLD